MPSLLPNLSADEPAGLPRGTVRAIVTVMLVIVSAIMLFVPVAVGNGDVKSMFLLLTGIAVRDYFAARAEVEKNERPPMPEPAVNE